MLAQYYDMSVICRRTGARTILFDLKVPVHLDIIRGSLLANHHEWYSADYPLGKDRSEYADTRCAEDDLLDEDGQIVHGVEIEVSRDYYIIQ